jgi:hypothetical protein
VNTGGTRSAVSKGNTGASEGTATHSAVAEGNAPPPVNTGGTRSAVSKGNTGACEGTTTHSAVAEGNAPPPVNTGFAEGDVGTFCSL